MIDKFRAWDKKRKCWYGSGHPAILTFYGFAIFGECTMLCTPPVSELINLEITQSTGLFDKDGVEIYEGDLLEDHLENGLTVNLGKVYFEHGKFCCDNGEEWGWITDTCSVVGNIYGAKTPIIEIPGYAKIGL